MVVSRCAITIVVRFVAASRASSAACTTRSLSVSSADVASSSSRIAGFFRIARAIAIRCFCPPESWPMPIRVSKPCGHSRMKASAFALRAACSI
mmetsp:Transcript_36949/g.91950  ORF Transcript_36949/g.91950 Transcript_36949/m.91950 type:complete len:94 (+) Transcript_36949:863-1144(+)